jgi:hypothetical protein
VAQGLPKRLSSSSRPINQLVEHAFLETESALSVYNPDGTVTVYASTAAHATAGRSPACSPPEARVRVVVPPVGGVRRQGRTARPAPRRPPGLEDPPPGQIVRPARSPSVLHIKRHPMIVRYKSGAAADGRLSAIEVQVIETRGPPTPASRSLGLRPRWPSVPPGAQRPPGRVHLCSPTTQSVNMRGFGTPDFCLRAADGPPGAAPGAGPSRDPAA